MAFPFDVRDWYWYVAFDQTRAYSSKVKDYVPNNDPTFRGWRLAGNTPTSIATEHELGEVLANYNDMTLQPVAAGVLDGYSDFIAARTTATYVNRLLFEYENRLRALEGQPAMSATEFRQKIKGLV
jgi:hypothetical protein